MSLGVVIKGPEGVVLAADSRVTLEAKNQDQALIVNFDNASKVLSFSGNHNRIGAVTFGAAVINLRTAHSFIPEFESNLPEGPLTVEDFAKRLSEFFLAQWTTASLPPKPAPINMSFIVGGFDPGAPYGTVFSFDIPNAPDPVPKNAGADQFGMTWGGQTEVASRLVQGWDPGVIPALAAHLGRDPSDIFTALQAVSSQLQFKVPYQVLPLQDCIDLAIFLIRTTMSAQQLSIGVRGVGGAIEAAYITRNRDLTFVQQKCLHGEAGRHLQGVRYD